MIKHKYIYTFIFTIILTISFSQNTINQLDEFGKRHGVWTKNFSDTNQKRYEGTFNHGKEIGTFKYYKLLKGKSVLSAIKEFNSTNTIALVTFFTSTKKVVSKGKMNGKLFVGEWIYYHKNSDAVMLIENYNNNGKLEGERKVFYKNGVTAEFANYKDGMLNGEARYFSEGNKVLRIANYKNGLFHGLYKVFGPKGKIITKGEYKDDDKIGLWYYLKDGKEKTVDYSLPN